METNGSTQQPLTATNGRRIKFTPERLQQIKNLVERGISREQRDDRRDRGFAAGHLFAAGH